MAIDAAFFGTNCDHTLSRLNRGDVERGHWLKFPFDAGNQNQPRASSTLARPYLQYPPHYPLFSGDGTGSGGLGISAFSVSSSKNDE